MCHLWPFPFIASGDKVISKQLVKGCCQLSQSSKQPCASQCSAFFLKNEPGLVLNLFLIFGKKTGSSSYKLGSYKMKRVYTRYTRNCSFKGFLGVTQQEAVYDRLSVCLTTIKVRNKWLQSEQKWFIRSYFSLPLCSRRASCHLSARQLRSRRPTCCAIHQIVRRTG